MMQRILRITSSDWEFTVSGPDQCKRFAMLRRTLRKRAGSEVLPKSTVALSNPLDCTVAAREYDSNVAGSSMAELALNGQRIVLPGPLLFDNTGYRFQFAFRAGINVSNVVIKHPLKRIENAFEFTPISSFQPTPSIGGHLDTRNNIGWLRLRLEYFKGNEQVAITVSMQVFSAKLDNSTDLPRMYKSIEQGFPLWRYRLARMTEQEMSRGRARGDFPIMWLAQYRKLRENIDIGLKMVINAPHNRLTTHVRSVKADRLKGRIDYRLAEKASNDLVSGIEHRRYKKGSKRLSVDTPENRFIRMVVQRIAASLSKYHDILDKHAKSNDEDGLSTSFLSELLDGSNVMRHVANRTFLTEVGRYNGMKNESLVLQQRPGYSKVYRAWLELRYYLDMFDARTSISMRTIDEIYEIWCFLELRRILIDELGFAESGSSRKGSVKLETGIERDEPEVNLFVFTRSDGLTVKLEHEPVFTAKISDSRRTVNAPIRTYRLEHKPDIMLSAIFSDGRECAWLFDAKYRLASVSKKKAASEVFEDLVPEDALHQMHRYRDALIRVETEDGIGLSRKSRPVLAAFALYPGYFNQRKEDNPYAELIHEVGIGAFALLPGSVNDESVGRHWLSQYLIDQLGEPPGLNSSLDSSAADHLYVQEPARIPYHGMRQNLHKALVMVAGLGAERNASYHDEFVDRTAIWYHCPVSTFDARYSMHVVRELEYLAIAVPDAQSSSTLIDYIWPIIRVMQLPRNEITEQQSGSKVKAGLEDTPYWLFRLGTPTRLQKAITGFPPTDFIKSLRITTLQKLSEVEHHGELTDIYANAISRE